MTALFIWPSLPTGKGRGTPPSPGGGQHWVGRRPGHSINIVMLRPPSYPLLPKEATEVHRRTSTGGAARTWRSWGPEPGLSALRAPVALTHTLRWGPLGQTRPSAGSNQKSPQKSTSPGPSALALRQVEVGAHRYPPRPWPTQPHRPLQPTARGPSCCVVWAPRGPRLPEPPPSRPL